MQQVKLHLGCGNIHLDDFINIDIVKTEAVDKVADIRKLDYQDNLVNTIYCCHVLEHFTKPEVPLVLKEWYRVLKPGGEIILVVPNINRWALRYLLNPLFYVKNKIRSFFTKEKVAHLKEVEEVLIENLFGGDFDYEFISYHKTGFNPRIMKKLSKEAGFLIIERVDLNKNNFPIFQVNPKKLHWSSMAFKLVK